MAQKVTPNSYTLLWPIVRETLTADGTKREDMIREAGHTFQLRRAKGRHLQLFEKIKNELEQTYAVISHATGLDLEEVRDMDCADIKGLQEILEDFMSGGPSTGKPA